MTAPARLILAAAGGLILVVVVALLITAGGDDAPGPSPASQKPAEDVPVPDYTTKAPKEKTPARPVFSRDRLRLSGRVGQGPFTETLMLRNAGDRPFTVERVVPAGLAAVDLGNGCDSTVAPGTACRIGLEVAATRPVTASGEIMVVHDAGAPVSVPVELAVRPRPTPEVHRDPVAEARTRLRHLRARRARAGRGTALTRRAAAPDPTEPAESGPEPVAVVEGSRPRDLRRTLPAGHVIDATLYTAINTEKCGPVVAYVDKPVYGAHGWTEVLPRYTRFVGTCKALGRHGESRVAVQWTRLERPDGAVWRIEEQAADMMGRNALPARINDRTWELIGKSLLLTMVSGISSAGAAAVDAGTTVRQAGQGVTRITPDPGGEGARAAARTLNAEFARLMDILISRHLDMRPTGTVPRGTPISVVVTRDIRLAPPPAPEARRPARYVRVETPDQSRDGPNIEKTPQQRTRPGRKGQGGTAGEARKLQWRTPAPGEPAIGKSPWADGTLGGDERKPASRDPARTAGGSPLPPSPPAEPTSRRPADVDSAPPPPALQGKP